MKSGTSADNVVSEYAARLELRKNSRFALVLKGRGFKPRRKP